MTPSAAGAKHNITVGAGEKDPIGTLLVLGGVSAVLVGGGQALGSAALAAAAYLPVLAINYYGMKPRTRVCVSHLSSLFNHIFYLQNGYNFGIDFSNFSCEQSDFFVGKLIW